MARFSPLRAFLASDAAGGIALIAAAVVAMILANSPLAAGYEAALHLTTGPVLAPAIGPMTVHLWINDGAMALFFLLVGLEIKRALIDGELADPARRRLPIVAAAAGMAVPALIFLAVTRHDPALRVGWAIPAATDIAFAVGIMALLGPRVSPQLKLFLTTVAIADDMGAVAIIAVAYSHGLDLGALAAAAGVLAIMAAMNRPRRREADPVSGRGNAVVGAGAAIGHPRDRRGGAGGGVRADPRDARCGGRSRVAARPARTCAGAVDRVRGRAAVSGWPMPGCRSPDWGRMSLPSRW